MKKLKVLIIDDDVVQRKWMYTVVESTEIGGVSHVSPNGELGLEWLMNNSVDVVLLDSLLGEESCLEILKRMKQMTPAIEVVILTDEAAGQAQVTLEALKLGAMDFINKTSLQEQEKSAEKVRNQLRVLFTQIKVKHYMDGTSREVSPEPVERVNGGSLGSERKVRQDCRWDRADLVLIASSTGGPVALEAVVSKLPADFRQPVLLVQHMPPEFTKALAQSLDKRCALHVLEGRDGDAIQEGKIILSPGGIHMVVENTKHAGSMIRLERSPYVNGVRPAADVLFKSVAREYAGRSILAVILTGMGSDGVQGILELKKSCNCYCISQSEETCVVYGMPRSIYEAGLSDEVCNLEDIANRVDKLATGRR